MKWPLGICELAWPRTATVDCARHARSAGFAHLDVVRSRTRPSNLAVPVGAHLTGRPGSGWASTAPPRTAHWDDMIAALRDCGEPRIEPWAGSLVGSDAAVARLVEMVPSVRLVVDVGHVVTWGGNPLAYLHLADHVQLRQAAPGHGQLPPNDGDVDFDAIFKHLRATDYRGVLSIEYFDLPQLGWPLKDPLEMCVGLADLVRPMLVE